MFYPLRSGANVDLSKENFANSRYQTDVKHQNNLNDIFGFYSNLSIIVNLEI